MKPLTSKTTETTHRVMEPLIPPIPSGNDKAPLPFPFKEMREFTGNYIGIINEDISSTEIDRIAKSFSLKLAHTLDFSAKNQRFYAESGTALEEADGLVLDKLKIVLLNPHSEATHRYIEQNQPHQGSPFLTLEKERYVYASEINAQKLGSGEANSNFDTAEATWGIQATRVPAASSTGKNIGIAILDTGFNHSHPDFRNRNIQSKSFLPSFFSLILPTLLFTNPAEDKNGHGTHCTGIAAGYRERQSNQRYGIAKDANILIGQVLDRRGQGTDSSVLRAIAWAVEQNCRIISMSFAGIPGKIYSESYERTAQEALKRNCLIIAAAGNNSDRQKNLINPVGHPANCPSILAVGAVEENNIIANFCCGELVQPIGRQIDILGPGVKIHSAWKNGSYNTASGTSTAVPFVAGIAALIWEENPQATAVWVKSELLRRAKTILINNIGDNLGLVQY